jgi:hypothetical protein
MPNTNPVQNEFQGQFQTYCCGGILGMHVPQGFDVPASAKLFSAWTLWINGNPGHKSFDNSMSDNILLTPI